jgi:FkbM family methyltransferase
VPSEFVKSELRTGMPVPRDTIVEIYRYILGREPESAAVVDSKAEHFASVAEARLATLRCEEFADQLTNLGIVHAGQLTADTIEDWIDYSDLFAFHGYAEEDLQLFSQFDTSRVIATPGFLTDWIGSRVRLSSLWRSAASEGADRSVLPLPIPCDYHAATIEWIGMLKAVLASVRSFSAIELGAGHGPWLAASSAAARALGIDELHLRGVEADPGRFALLQQNMDDNQLSTADTILYNAAIGAKGGRARWPRLDDPIEESGARFVRDGNEEDRTYLSPYLSSAGKSKEFIDVEIIPLSPLLRSRIIWDLVHIDVQGTELELCEGCIEDLNAHVRYLIIGTHSRWLEGDLMKLFLTRGWRLEHEMPAKLLCKPYFELNFDASSDGTQVWRNPRL